MPNVIPSPKLLKPRRKKSGAYRMVPVMNKTRKAGVRDYRFERIDTNEEILQRAMNQNGVVRLRVMFQIYDPQTGVFAGLRGSARSFQFKSPLDAERFIAAVKNLQVGVLNG